MAAARDVIVVLGEVVGAVWRARLGQGPAVCTELPTPARRSRPGWLKPARGGDWREVTKVDGRMHSGTLLVALDGVDTREAALAMKGSTIGVPRAALPAAGASEIYWDDLTGLAVRNRTGVMLGEVVGHDRTRRASAAAGGAAAGGERAGAADSLRPAIIDRVDLAAGTIDVDWGEDF